MTSDRCFSFSGYFRRLSAVRTILVITLLAGLSSSGYAEDRGVGGKRDVDVASVNLYVGADFFAIASLDPTDPAFFLNLLGAVAGTYGKIVASDFPSRADALAQEIVARGPDLIALQEVSLIRRQSPGDSIFGGVPATEVELDYLEILLDALRRHGGHYAVVSQVQDIDVEVPLVTAFGLDDIRLTDRDVILARTDLPPGHLVVSNPQSANFIAALPLPIGVNVLRGWCSIDVWGRDRHFRLINTHLEDGLGPLQAIQASQAAELLLVPAATTLPVILAGDFNSDANGFYSPATYTMLTGAGGFKDAWSEVHPGDPGLTWGHDEFLADPLEPFLLRIDLVLYRGLGLRAEDAELVDPEVGPAPPLWSSDHKSVFATLSIH